MYISCVNRQGRSYIVAVCICHTSIMKEDVIELPCVYIMCQSSRKKFKVALCIYHVSIVKEEVIKL